MGEYISRIEVGGNPINAMLHLPTPTLRSIVLRLADGLRTGCTEPESFVREAITGDNERILADVAEFLYSIVAVSLRDGPLGTLWSTGGDAAVVTKALEVFEEHKRHVHIYPFMEKDFTALNKQLLDLWSVRS